jgi:hypothetical protein
VGGWSKREQEEVGRRRVERLGADEHAKRRGLGGISAAQTRLNDVLLVLESELTIAQAAEELGISVEATSALIEASLRSGLVGAQ